MDDKTEEKEIERWRLDYYKRPMLSPSDCDYLTVSITARGIYIKPDTELIYFGRKKNVGGRRGQVKEFSEASKRKMKNFLSCLTTELRYMVTLTYPKDWPSDGELVKRQQKEMIRRYKREQPNNFLFWFLEFQARGAPHFHWFTTEPVGKKWLSKQWFEIVGSGDEKHLKAGTRIEKLRAGTSGARVYALKYAAKSEQKQVPNGYESIGRFWGYSGKFESIKLKARLDDEKIPSGINEDLASLPWHRFENGGQYAAIDKEKAEQWVKKLENLERHDSDKSLKVKENRENKKGKG
jgi:hypothetical protein